MWKCILSKHDLVYKHRLDILFCYMFPFLRTLACSSGYLVNQGNFCHFPSEISCACCSRPSFLPPDLFSLIPSIPDLGLCSLSPTSYFEALLLKLCSAVAWPCSCSVLSPWPSCMGGERYCAGCQRIEGWMEFLGVAAPLCDSSTIVGSGWLKISYIE